MYQLVTSNIRIFERGNDMISMIHESLVYSVYFAPRGKKRILTLGNQIAQRYLSPMDGLIGFVGDAGAGKSVLIKGMFPGLELTNDDEGINVRPLPIMEDADESFFSCHTYHLDVRFESAFTQMHELAEAVLKALQNGKRVIVEHFDLLYPVLNVNADLLVGIGEEVFVARPTIFGPNPKEVAGKVFSSVRYRRMAHSAEDITGKILQDEFGYGQIKEYNDVRRGFVLEFDTKPDVDLYDLEKRVMEVIEADVEISYHGEKSILINNETYPCTGPRIHVKSSGEIKHYHLHKEIKYNPLTKVYSIIGTVGRRSPDSIDYMVKLSEDDNDENNGVEEE
jgi:hypothetical protein